MLELPPLPDDIVASCNTDRGGFNRTLGLEFVRIEYDKIVARIPVTPQLQQPYGIVHGGVYCSIVETLASVGAALNAMAHGNHAVGLENNTSFLRAVRDGTLHAIATPVTRGRRSQVWSVSITNDDQQPVATGRVRLLCLEQEASLAGEAVTMKTR